MCVCHRREREDVEAGQKHSEPADTSHNWTLAGRSMALSIQMQFPARLHCCYSSGFTDDRDQRRHNNKLQFSFISNKYNPLGRRAAVISRSFQVPLSSLLPVHLPPSVIPSCTLTRASHRTCECRLFSSVNRLRRCSRTGS